MKFFVLIILLLTSGYTQQPTAPAQTVLTFEQVVGWLNSYGSVLDKDLAAATSKFGDPDGTTRYSRTWNPSSKTGFRTITAGIAEAAEGEQPLIRRITILPGETDVFTVDQLLHQPEMFLFEAGRNAKQESYLDVETKNRQFKFRFLCAPERAPRLQFVELKSVASPDDVL
jgi:hypothetical protein